MVNGQVNPRLYTKTGQIQRWRILNASSARFYRLSLENHTFFLIGTDGGLLDQPYLQSEILFIARRTCRHPGQDQRRIGNFRLRALSYSRMGMMTSATITS